MAKQLESTADALSIRNAELVYQTRQGPLKALDGVDLEVGQGEFVSVLGPSGCGKSSLLRLVSGLLPPTAGEIHVSGSMVDGPRDDVGIVFQQPTLLPWKTVLDNVLIPIRAMGRPRDAYLERARSLVALVGLADFEKNYPFELSGGMQQRVGVARGLVHDPRLLLMDEPFAALDAMTRENMMAELQRIWQETRNSVLFITHSIPEAVFLSDRVTVMSPRPGRIVRTVPIDLPRPRTVETMATDRFAQITGDLRAMFTESAEPAS
ncbi:MAG: ABC transporter ATP-binding protein [Roseitalea porphyridii]|uniref:ABC transporter ATP-binding protein n=1 Tax=Roseitalea porphyridii TaxID=1852022 RepID=UPI0032EF883A